ncbi:MAG TPA: Dabb family protein [Acidimicrobiales bacterium]|nr:Dabb family protein [Acidimicrobiales bacterium]
MLRRFEVYALRPDAPADAVVGLEEACRRCGRFIPEVLDSAVGTNLSDAPVQLVWEHGYASPEAYRRYMVHPYHAAVIDRYLLPDAPERIVIDGPLGAGLYGYRCDTPSYRMSSGVRRLVLLHLDNRSTETDVARLAETLEEAPTDVGGMAVSIVAANSMGSAWFDGVTPLMGPPRWTHIWEQGFSSLEALEDYRHGDSSVAAVERGGWDRQLGGIVKRSAELFYEVSRDTEETSGHE